ncbi:MAG: hypothetical protein ACRCTY_07285 [Candidatus Adiutrix sp.]
MNHLKFFGALAAIAFFLACDGPLWAASAEYSSAQKWDLFLRFMNFAVFIGVILYFAAKPLSKFFRERKENIASNLEYLETQARHYEEQTELMKLQIANIEAEREKIIAQYETIGRNEAERIINEAKKAAETIIKKTEATMLLEASAARQLLLLEIVKLSTKAAEELIVTNINGEDQKRLTHEFMSQVEKIKHQN